MGAIIYDARRIKAYERIRELGEYAGKDQTVIDALWKELVLDGELMKEFIYYLDYHTFLDEVKCRGNGLTDLYVWLLKRYNLMQDSGKNGADCNKEALVLDAFSMMVDMKKNPEAYTKRLNDGLGMDDSI